MILPRPSAPFERLEIQGESITIDVSGKVLVIPTGNQNVLPSFNEFSINRVFPAGTYSFTDDYNSETGLQNLQYMWVAVYNPNSTTCDFFLFTQIPKNLQFVVSSVSSKLVIYPGNGLAHRGQIEYPDLKKDTNSDMIPDWLDQSVTGSLSKFLQSYRITNILYSLIDGGYPNSLSDVSIDGGYPNSLSDVSINGGILNGVGNN